VSSTESNAPSPRSGDTIRGKWTMDGATTLTEAAERLEALAGQFRTLEAAGWSLASPVEDDYGVLQAPHRDADRTEDEPGPAPEHRGA
jgi:hypothetical protein